MLEHIVEMYLKLFFYINEFILFIHLLFILYYEHEMNFILNGMLTTVSVFNYKKPSNFPLHKSMRSKALNNEHVIILFNNYQYQKYSSCKYVYLFLTLDTQNHVLFS